MILIFIYFLFKIIFNYEIKISTSNAFIFFTGFELFVEILVLLVFIQQSIYNIFKYYLEKTEEIRNIKNKNKLQKEIDKQENEIIKSIKNSFNKEIITSNRVIVKTNFKLIDDSCLCIEIIKDEKSLYLISDNYCFLSSIQEKNKTKISKEELKLAESYFCNNNFLFKNYKLFFKNGKIYGKSYNTENISKVMFDIVSFYNQFVLFLDNNK